jgi:2,3-bisphosphoglycerate-independent phosphoglycerate mutase
MGILDIFKPKPSSTQITGPLASGIKPVVLLILDGFGIAPASPGNAISLAKKPNIDSIIANFPQAQLIASGESVGLPANEVGNTEVGHLNLGAGRPVYQDLVRINRAIKDQSFYDNRAFLAALDHVRQHNSKFHLVGLVGGGNVHSSMEHFWALLEFCKRQKLEVYLHLITDGRDSPPQQGIEIVTQISRHLKEQGIGKIATVAGRYWSMDRDKRWKRTQKGYEAMVSGKGGVASSALEAVNLSYAAKRTDEFVEPTVIVEDGHPVATVDDNDAVVFFNFRIDRPRQLTMAFVLDNFEKLTSFDFGADPEKGGRKEGEVKFGETFVREKVPKNLFFVTMTEYQKDLPVGAIAFPKEEVKEGLAQLIAAQNWRQFHLSESEKERFVTFYFDGMHEGGWPGEDIKIVASPKVATYAQKPEMSVFQVVAEFQQALATGAYHFFVINFANCDMVGHSGDLQATIQAVQHVDQAVGQVMKDILAVDGTLLITADHGNAEELISYPTQTYFVTTAEGEVNTDHSNNPVPLFVVGNRFRGARNLGQGTLNDVAPTILGIMGIAQPAAMTGRNLLA